MPAFLLHEATDEAQVVAAVRCYLDRLSPVAKAQFPAGVSLAVASADDIAELALVLSRERSGRFGATIAGVNLVPVETFLARACVRLAQLQKPAQPRARTAARA